MEKQRKSIGKTQLEQQRYYGELHGKRSLGNCETKNIEKNIENHWRNHRNNIENNKTILEIQKKIPTIGKHWTGMGNQRKSTGNQKNNIEKNKKSLEIQKKHIGNHRKALEKVWKIKGKAREIIGITLKTIRKA